VDEEDCVRLQRCTTADQSELTRRRPDYSGTQIGQAFKPAAEACSFLPFFRVMTGLKMSL
jgi:hypothetical protein